MSEQNDAHPDPLEFGVIDYLLGEGDESERATLRAAVAADPGLALEFGETRVLLDELRSLTCEASPTATLSVRYSAWRRAELRGAPVFSIRDRLSVSVRVAAVAAVFLILSDFLFSPDGSGLLNGSGRSMQDVVAAVAGDQDPFGSGAADRDPDLAATGLDEPVIGPHAALLATLPIDEPSFVRGMQRLGAVEVPDDFAAWLSADNRLANLRHESELRFSRAARQATRAKTGAADVDDRVDRLAAVLAARGSVRLTESGSVADRERTGDIASVLRGLLAAGSSRTRGEHRAVVAACAEDLLGRFADLDSTERAEALFALGELAIVEGGPLERFVATAADELARATVVAPTLETPQRQVRPVLLHWRTPVGLLGEAGRFFAVAPAFGADAWLSLRSRMLIAGHLYERRDEHRSVETPALLAAQLYGFGDMVDRRDLDLRLSLWRLRLLSVGDYSAVHHLAWSRYPVGSGWAEFQRELLELAGQPTPVGTRDSSSLLLTLCANVAAPGVLHGIRIAAL